MIRYIELQNPSTFSVRNLYRCLGETTSMPAKRFGVGPRAAPAICHAPAAHRCATSGPIGQRTATSWPSQLNLGARRCDEASQPGASSLVGSEKFGSLLSRHIFLSCVRTSKRKAAALVRERDAFMRRLERERNDRSVLETWAYRIQAIVSAPAPTGWTTSARGLKPTDDARRRQTNERQKEGRRPEIYEESI